LEFNVPFQDKYVDIRDERSGVESYPYPMKEDQTRPTLSAFLFSSHPKRERDREAHLNYYASAYNGKTTITPQDKTKSNKTKTSIHP